MSERPAAPAGYSWHDVDPGGPAHLEILTGGPADGFPLVYHSGTPSGAAPFGVLVDAGAERGFRTITYSRPGYGTSAAARGRVVADAATDTHRLLGSLGYSDDSPFVTAGWSGGGPHALACAALLSDRCRGAAVIAGVAPFEAAGLDWTAGMADENLEEFEMARKGPEALAELLGTVSELLTALTEPAALAEGFGGLVTDRDRETIVNSGLGTYLIEALAQAVLESPAGWRDDDLAFVSPWGFDPGAIDQPVGIWQGTEDLMVPATHGRWLASEIPSARLELGEGEGHLSMALIAIPQLLDDFAVVAGIGS
jgi:pimeloyl-ACP methyl ester carboxylesterase